MNKEDLKRSMEIIRGLINKYSSMREFARAINEDASDVIKWRDGMRVKPRAVVTITKIFNIQPSLLRPDLFPSNLRMTFK